MQRCPKCNRTYSNDAQKFCTHDGGRLERMDSVAPPAFDPNQTIRAEASDLSAPGDAATSDLNATMAFPPATTSTAEIRPSDTAPTGRQRPPESTPEALQSPHTSSSSAHTSAPLPHTPPPPPPPAPVPQTSEPLPPAATLPPQASPQIPGPSYAAATPPARKSAVPLILGVIALLLLTVGGASILAYFMIIKPRMSSAEAPARVGVNTPAPDVNVNANTNVKLNENAGVVVANENAENNNTESEFKPPADAEKFENSSDELKGKLAEHYVKFSFYYPESWEIEPAGGATNASNFVKVERKLPPDFPQERLNVSWYESKGTFEADEKSFPMLVETYSARFQNLPGYRKVSEGETTINSLKGYEFRFEGLTKGTEKGDIAFWGRVVFLPPGVEGEKNGVTLLMLTSSLAPELEGVEDVGVKGELPLILESFRFGSN